ncbi:hypothetical protein ABS772_18375 [Methylorubrum podarium]|uniref:Right-handed parallel beta-helix repeat-containing protein n=1 Tax=Methylorubrum podarium TaxID=200476 RepID=A0ABV1QR44_9HYPH
MKRLLSSLALLLTLAGAAFGQTAVLPRPEVRGNNVVFGSVVDLGPRVGNKLDLSTMYATTPGGIARTLADMLANEVYAVNYGVVANDGIDDSVAARKALKAAMDRRGTVVWPAGNISLCTDPADAEALLRIDRFVNMRGTRTTQFNPCPEAGTRSTILIKPLANNPIRGAFIKDLIVVPAGGDAIRVETPDTNGVVAKLLVENVGTGMPQKGYYAFRHINSYTADAQGNPLTGNFTGGMFGSTFRDSDFIGGMRFELTGDSNNIERNVINGPNEGIYYKAIGGAATHRINGNNITATGDTIVIDGGQQVYITENQLEAVGDYTGSRTNPAVITIINAISVAVRNNNINAYSRSDAVAALSGSQGVSVEANTVNYAANKLLFRAVASPNNTVGRQLYEGIGGAPKTGQSLVSVDAASPTIGVWQQLTLLNNWAAASDTSFRQGLWWMPLTDGTIRLAGTVAGGTTTAGTSIATLPANFRPVNKAVRLPGLVYLNNIVNGSPWATGVYLVDLSGNISIQFMPTIGAGSFLQFDGSSFSIRP